MNKEKAKKELSNETMIDREWKKIVQTLILIAIAFILMFTIALSIENQDKSFVLCTVVVALGIMVYRKLPFTKETKVMLKFYLLAILGDIFGC